MMLLSVAQREITVSLTAAAQRTRNSVVARDAMIRPQKCAAKILPHVR